ncbi:cyclin-dependent kinase inhibitor 1C, partial [Drosophila subobscura]|uniref:cyclin-dependent kinase inhibitor 1C n=1 Tax=Drosophila subobscura TaxID=7241 RepID=UPI00155B2A68
MFAKIVLAALCVATAQAGLLPFHAGPVPLAAPVATAGVVAPYASSFNAHRINHAVAYPVAPAPVAFAAPAPVPVAAPAPVAFAAPAPAFAAP